MAARLSQSAIKALNPFRKMLDSFSDDQLAEQAKVTRAEVALYRASAKDDEIVAPDVEPTDAVVDKPTVGGPPESPVCLRSTGNFVANPMGWKIRYRDIINRSSPMYTVLLKHFRAHMEWLDDSGEKPVWRAFPGA